MPSTKNIAQRVCECMSNGKLAAIARIWEYNCRLWWDMGGSNQF